jgi:predicted acyltransferase
VLVWLGVFLRSVGKGKTYFTFEDTLSQIGLGYLPLVVLALFKPRVWLVALVLILIGYWALFALWPLPPDGFDRTTVGAKADWKHDFDGFAAHWNLNRNPAAEFDAWFLKKLRGDTAESYKYNGGGYATLSFIPTLGTMILGLFAGLWLTGGGSERGKVGLLALAGLGLLAVGYALGAAGVCPVVKKIWTPSWVLFSGGWCFLLLAAFHALTDATGYGGWSYPLRVIGANSIFIYVVDHLPVKGFILDSVRTHFGKDVFAAFGPEYVDLTQGATVLLVYWLVLWWMYARKVFVRV